jgi:hypothetical protein
MSTIVSTKFVHTAAPQTDAVDWHALADELFPAEALRPAPPFNPLAMVRNSV